MEIEKHVSFPTLNFYGSPESRFQPISDDLISYIKTI